MKKTICLFLTVITLISSIPFWVIAEERPFPDVPADAWYTEYIVQANEMGLMQGDEKGNMMPTKPITRAEAVEFLYKFTNRAYNYPEVDEIPFSDVPNTAWYYNSVKWAYCIGLIKGTGSNKFKPNDLVTRQDLAVMISRYYNMPISEDKGILSYSFSSHFTLSYSSVPIFPCEFKDSNDISDYAKDALFWLTSYHESFYDDNAHYEHPIMYGVYKDYIAPKKSCTRAECVTMLLRTLDSPLFDKDYRNNRYADILPDSPYASLIYDCTNHYFPENWKFENTAFFNPEEEVTFAELIQTFVKRYRRYETTYNEYSCGVEDPYLETAYRNGWLKLDENGTIDPDAVVTREQVVYYYMCILNFYNNNPMYDYNGSSFSDWNEISDEYLEAMTWAINLKKPIFPSDMKEIRPGDNCTRIELLKIIYEPGWYPKYIQIGLNHKY